MQVSDRIHADEYDQIERRVKHILYCIIQAGGRLNTQICSEWQQCSLKTHPEFIYQEDLLVERRDLVE